MGKSVRLYFNAAEMELIKEVQHEAGVDTWAGTFDIMFQELRKHRTKCATKPEKHEIISHPERLNEIIYKEAEEMDKGVTPKNARTMLDRIRASRKTSENIQSRGLFGNNSWRNLQKKYYQQAAPHTEVVYETLGNLYEAMLASRARGESAMTVIMDDLTAHRRAGRADGEKVFR